MGREYRAFISYRHAEVDSKVAAEVQRSLERFHIPAEVRQSTGVKSLAPIFRDKEELPVTAELSDDIGSALASSSHLIVICSPRLKESTWCQREIATFLQTHPVQNVLTVLAEGEPYDVIPEVLLKRPKTVTLDDGSTQEVLVDAEPLSCDFRSFKRSEHRTEVTRLAAAMLGVPFDALWRRQQRRRRRLLTVAAMLAAAVIAYGTWSLITIRSEYRETLCNQSRTFARDAQALYENGNTLEAIELSLAALPGEGGDRPLVAEAELALQQTSRAYVPPSTDKPILRALVSDYGVVRSFDLGHDVAGIRCTPGGETVAAWSYSGDLACWDAGSGNELYREDFDEYSIVDVHLLDAQRLLVAGHDDLRCVDLTDGSDAWHRESSFGSFDEDPDDPDDVDFFAWSVGVDERSGQLVLLDRAFEPRLLLLDAQSGAVQGEIGLKDVEGEMPTLADAEMDVDEGACAIPWDVGGGYGHNGILLVDLEKGTCRVADTEFAGVVDVSVLPQGRVLVTSAAGDDTVASSRWTGWSVTEESLFAYQMRLSCLEVATGKTIWTRDVDLWQVSDAISVLPVTLAMGEASPLEAVAWCGANACVWLDPNTGEFLGRIETASSFRDAWAGPGWTDADGNEFGVIEGCLADGSFVVCTPARGQSMSARRFPEDATCAMSSSAGEFVVDGTQVLLNSTGQGDDSWTVLTDDYYQYDEMVHTPKGLLAFDTFGSEDGAPSVALFDLAGRGEAWRTSLEGPEGGNATYLGPTADNGAQVLLIRDAASEEGTLATVSTESGEVAYTSVKGTVPTADTVSEALCGDQATLAGGTVVSTVGVEDDFTDLLCLTNLETLESTLLDIQTQGPSIGGVGDSSGKALMATDYAEAPEGSEDTCYACVVIDTGSGTSWSLDTTVYSSMSGSMDRLAAVWGDDGMLYVRAPSQIVAYQRDGRRAFTVACEESAFAGMGVSESEFWLCSWDDDQLALRWYDARTGKLTDECHPDVDVSVDNSYATARLFELASSAERNAGQFVLTIDEQAAVMDRTGAVFQLVEKCYDYDDQSDTFVVGNPDVASSGFGVYGRYSLDALIERGQSLLGDSRMSERRRRELGA